jgi:hypothetical protein
MPRRGPDSSSHKVGIGAGGCWHFNGYVAFKGNNTSEFWRYDVPTNSWTAWPSIPLYGYGSKRRVRDGGGLTSIGNRTFYAIKGKRSLQFWRYAIPPGEGGEQQCHQMVYGKPSIAAESVVYDATGRKLPGLPKRNPGVYFVLNRWQSQKVVVVQ